MSEPLFKVNDKFIVTIAEVYTTEQKPDAKSRSADYVYRMKGAIPLMREGQLKLLEKVNED